MKSIYILNPALLKHKIDIGSVMEKIMYDAFVNGMKVLMSNNVSCYRSHESEQYRKCTYKITLWHILIIAVLMYVSVKPFLFNSICSKKKMNTEHTAMGTE